MVNFVRMRMGTSTTARWAGVLLVVALLGVVEGLAETKSVVINELLVSNGSVLADEDGAFADWIELVNVSPQPVDLEGWTITDDPVDPKKWIFPTVTIDPGGFLLIWASGKDRRTPGTWDFWRPLALSFQSAGYNDGDEAEILVGQQDKCLNQTGINVVRLDEDGRYIESTVFDTYCCADNSEAMIRFLNGLSAGDIVILAVRDEASDQLDSDARAVLESLGSEAIGRLGYWDSWGMISVVGHEKLVEDYRPNGAGPASGFIVSKAGLHTNFKLDKDGEYIGLYAPDGTVVDSVTFGSQTRDVSLGRDADGGEEWCLFSTPTPGRPNNTPSAEGVLEAPSPSVQSGFYDEAVTVTFGKPEGAEVFYTTDGSVPTRETLRYSGPIRLENTCVLRARCFRDESIPSPVVTQTYFIKEGIHLSVVSLVTDPSNLWDERSGIYVEGLYPDRPNYLQQGRDWERPVYLEFFEGDHSLGFSLEAGLQIHGDATRSSSKKSFLVKLRDAYGVSSLDYPIFWEDEFDKHAMTGIGSFVLRNLGNDGLDSLPRIRDPLLHALWFEEGGLVCAKRSVFVFLNGVPWGIYNIREHPDSDYLRSNLGVQEVDLILRDLSVEAGDSQHWEDTLAFFETHDLSSPADYAVAASLIEVPNYTDFCIFQIYAGNVDLVDNLVRFRPRTADGKWRWVMWDVDLGFGLEPETPVSHDTLEWHTRDRHRPDFWHDWADSELWTTVILRRLLENEEYRIHFINRFADLLNSTLQPDHVVGMIDALVSVIEPDMPEEFARWGGSLDEWVSNVEQVREFARQRPAYVREDIVAKFGLLGTASLVVQPPEGGQGAVRVNAVLPTAYPWKGVYFRGIPVTLRAEPTPGYRFVGWSDRSLQDRQEVTILLPESYEVRAYFAPSGQ